MFAESQACWSRHVKASALTELLLWLGDRGKLESGEWPWRETEAGGAGGRQHQTRGASEEDAFVLRPGKPEAGAEWEGVALLTLPLEEVIPRLSGKT